MTRRRRRRERIRYNKRRRQLLRRNFLFHTVLHWSWFAK